MCTYLRVGDAHCSLLPVTGGKLVANLRSKGGIFGGKAIGIEARWHLRQGGGGWCEGSNAYMQGGVV